MVHQDDGLNHPRPEGHLLSFHCSASVWQGGGPLTIESTVSMPGILHSPVIEFCRRRGILRVSYNNMLLLTAFTNYRLDKAPLSGKIASDLSKILKLFV